MKSLTDLTRDFHKATNTFKELAKKNPAIIGRLGVKVMHENFNQQGFCESIGAPQKWKERSPVTNKIYDENRKSVKNKKQAKKLGSNYKGSVYSSANPILKQTGNLYDSITYRTSANRVNIGVNLNQTPYAKINNEGGSQRFGSRWVRVPKRKFLGYSQKFQLRIESELRKARQNALKQFRKA